MVVVRISSADLTSRIQAYGFFAATSLNPAQSSLIATRWSSGVQPAAALMADSNIG